MHIIEDLHIFYSNLDTLSLHWLIFGVCIHLKKNHIFSLKWIQIFSIHELSSLWFLSRSNIYHLSYAFTLFITIDSFLHLIIYWVYTYEYIFSPSPLRVFFLCVFFPASCHSATAGVLWASFHSFFLINLIWLVGWTIASHSIAQIYSWKKIKRHRSKITSTSQKPWLQGQIFLQRSPFSLSLPLFSPLDQRRNVDYCHF